MNQQEIPESRYKCYRCHQEFRSDSQAKKIPCPKCDKQIMLDRAKIEFMAGSKKIQQLARGPVVDSSSDSYGIRQLAWKLKPPRQTKAKGTTKSRKGWNTLSTVKYLPGDERRAVTLFIEENADFIRDCLEDKSNPLQRQWDDYMFDLLVEQWSFLGFNEAA